jgi:hypothetical protein
MSTFANPSGSDAAATSAYVRALLDLLGDRQPLVVLEEMVPALRAAVAGLDGERLQRPERPGKWSVSQVVAHLADSDLVFGYRLRRVLAEDRPALEGYDQDRWADGLRYRDAKVEDSLAQFVALRAANLRLLRAATPADLERVGIHSERGDESVALMMRLYAAHDLVHRRQIDRIKAAVG